MEELWGICFFPTFGAAGRHRDKDLFYILKISPFITILFFKFPSITKVWIHQFLEKKNSVVPVSMFLLSFLILFSGYIGNRGMGSKYGGGEIRRLHIIYFLSRTGRVEQPHLIRVHHIGKNGVHLRDVKRWLSELRGKDMPDSFAWSYKRRYKEAYVWQDLLDDDLITPISDNEFVLKGSQIVPTDTGNREDNIKNPKMERSNSVPNNEAQTSIEASPPIIGSFGSGRSSVTDNNSVTYEEEKPLFSHRKHREEGNSSSSFPFPTFKGSDDDDVGNNISQASAKRKSVSNGSLFRNLLSCRAAETDDSVLVSRRKNQSLGSGKIGKYEKLGGSARVFGSIEHQKQQQARRSYDGGINVKKQKETIGHKAYKPVHGPTCSQCGKTFRPEKLHKHMKSCRGMARNKAP